MKIYLSTWIYEENQQQSLKRKRALNRLMSFYHLSDKKARQTLKGYFDNENKKDF
jgi:hypothetical protein